MKPDAAAAAAKTAKVAHGAKATASAAGKVAASGLSKSMVMKGMFVGGFAARRAAWPAVVVGTAFGGAAWFGCFEIVHAVASAIMPPPENPDPQAQMVGLATVPVMLSASAWLGWRTAPAIAPPPERMLDLAGWSACARSLPVRHCGVVGVGSAAVAAVACRAVQHRGGA